MNFSEKEKNFIRYVIKDRPSLIPVFNTPHEIPQRLRDFDKDAFIVYDKEWDKYEIHSLKSYYPRFKNWTTYQFTWQKELGEDLLVYMYENDITRRGQELFDFLDYESDRLEKDREKRGIRMMEYASQESKKTIRGYKDAF